MYVLLISLLLFFQFVDSQHDIYNPQSLYHKYLRGAIISLAQGGFHFCCPIGRSSWKKHRIDRSFMLMDGEGNYCDDDCWTDVLDSIILTESTDNLTTSVSRNSSEKKRRAQEANAEQREDIKKIKRMKFLQE